MAKHGIEETKMTSLYVDKWCAKNVRKVIDCTQCLHYEECRKAGHSISPRALKHQGVVIKDHWGNVEE